MGAEVEGQQLKICLNCYRIMKIPKNVNKCPFCKEKKLTDVSIRGTE
jgi:RNA polymerase subunit RPABC4/transcription elongation factor Spt4